MKGHGKIGPMPRHAKRPKMLERFKQAWRDGVDSAALAERFGMRQSNVPTLARRLGLKKRTS